MTAPYVSSRYPTAEQRAELERRVLADALYDKWERHGDAVTVTEPPLRGRVTLFSCYTPAYWYASCRSCQWMSAGVDDYADSTLATEADAHRCAAASFRASS